MLTLVTIATINFDSSILYSEIVLASSKILPKIIYTKVKLTFNCEYGYNYLTYRHK